MCRSVSEPVLLYQCISHCRATSLPLPHPTLTEVPWTYTLNSPQDSAPAPPPLFQLLDISFPEGLTWASAEQVCLPHRLSGNSHHSYCFYRLTCLPSLVFCQASEGHCCTYPPPSTKWGQTWSESTSTESSSRPSPTHPLSLLTGENKLCKTEQEVSSGESAWKISIGLVAVPLLVALVHVQGQ